MSLDQFKCFRCKIIPEKDVYECDKNKHIICLKCASRCHFKCKCSSSLKNRKSSPLLRIVENVDHPCHYNASGCKMKFPAAQMQTHLNECPNRPVHCIGANMNIWECPWKGQQSEMCVHFKLSHPSISQPFSAFQIAVVPFKRDTTLGTIKIINAFEKQFVFLYRTNGLTGLVFFIIYLMGPKAAAEQFIYKFTILSPHNPLRKIKFVESVYSDAENIHNKLNEGKCVVLASQKVIDMLDGENLNFRFHILRKDDAKKTKKQTTPNVCETKTIKTASPTIVAKCSEAVQRAQTAPVVTNESCSSINCPRKESNPFQFPGNNLATPNCNIAYTESSINKPYTMFEQAADNDFTHNKREVSCMTLNVPCTRINKR